MNKAILLYSDHGLSASILPNSVCEYFGADNFNLNAEVRNEILSESPLSFEMKCAMDKGKLIPDEVFDKLIDNFISLHKPRTIVFSNYPFTVDKYEKLKITLSQHDYSIEKILIFLQLDKEDLKYNYFQEEISSSWIQKFGEEVIENWDNLFTKRRTQINEVIENKWHNNYQVFEMPYEPNLTSEFILKILKGYA
jgi:adenylate kinase family enzyme